MWRWGVRCAASALPLAFAITQTKNTLRISGDKRAMFGVQTPLQGTITEKDNRESKGGADALLFKRVHMGVFAAGVDRVLRSCLS